MKKAVFILLFAILGISLVIQLFQPAKNRAPVTSNDFFAHIQAPESIKNKLIIGCYDCHSNQTKYPWYSNISPLSWLIADHVKNGKKELNFSEWGQLSKREQISALSGIAEVLEEKLMPLPSYIKLHKEAALTNKEIDAITTWTDKTIDVILE